MWLELVSDVVCLASPDLMYIIYIILWFLLVLQIR